MSYIYLTSQGVIVADTSTTLTGVQNEYLLAFGSDLIVVSAAATPQGVLINAETLARNNVLNNNAVIANQINPNIAGGVCLDAIGQLTGSLRIAGTPTVVPNVTLTGVANTNIPANVQASTAAGDLFQSVSAITLDADGNGTVNFQSVEEGPIPCNANALVNIVTGILGWETITNATAGTLGAAEQSDQAFRGYRLNTLGMNSISLAAAITSALYAVKGVTSLFFQENVAGTTQTINGISMGSHSIYVCVEGGADTDVAAALLENKGSGAGWNGGTAVSVVEPASGQVYTVTFDRPTPVPLLIQVTTPNGNSADIIQSILDYAAGLVQIVDQNGTTQTLQGFVVGGDVSPFDIAGAIMAENPGIYLTSVQLGLAPSGSLSPSPIVIDVNEIATIVANNISIVVP